ncbi:MAG: hypothetical protein IPK86_02455 [Neisseriales bacterium]|nr:MAG: hypothetical protein IPK86_02455 [Neisseriales bacterium]
MPDNTFPIWHDSLGQPLSCIEKIKVMRENLEELIQSAQDVFEDALLMGCDETQIRKFLLDRIHNLKNPYRPTTGNHDKSTI